MSFISIYKISLGIHAGLSKHDLDGMDSNCYLICFVDYSHGMSNISYTV